MRRAHLVLASARGLSPQPMAPRVGCGVQSVRHGIPALNTTGLAGMSKPLTRPKRVAATLNATPAARLQHRLHQAPRTYGTPTGVWTLARAAQGCPAPGVTARCMREATLRRALHRLQTTGQRAKHGMTRPAPDYARQQRGALVCSRGRGGILKGAWACRMTSGGAASPSPTTLRGQTPSPGVCAHTRRSGTTQRRRRSRVMGCDARIPRACAAAGWMGGRSVR
jgi:hypothetical protein